MKNEIEEVATPIESSEEETHTVSEVINEIPAELLPNNEDTPNKANLRNVYLAFWKQSANKWEIEKEVLLEKLKNIID